MTRYIVDTGPVVALINRSDTHHQWAVAVLARIPSPLFTCEGVLVEACHLLRKLEGGPNAVLQLVKRGALVVEPSLVSGAERIAELMHKYSSAPMSLTDACLVRMTELEKDCKVVTVDGHFLVYRRHGRQAVPVVIPDAAVP